MEEDLPLHSSHVPKLPLFINRLHFLFHSTALLLPFIYYRVRTSFLFNNLQSPITPILPWLLIFLSELLLSFIWLLGQAYRWRPISRTVFPERLPDDDKLPPIDVFICTADPTKEPTEKVMNALISAMALDYPPEKLHVYLSDDAGSALTLQGLKDAWSFAEVWISFCRKYGILNRCPEAYFVDFENYGNGDHVVNSESSRQFLIDRLEIKNKFDAFNKQVNRARENLQLEDTISSNTSKDQPAIVEVIKENRNDEELQPDNVKLPLLVYVSREKKPSQPHHFKAGALNVLLRISGVISNSPYILMLDCDMYCNDPTSARRAMCFHLDPNMISSLAFVQFPQRFHNVSENDIYDSRLRSAYSVQWKGMDGQKGPVLSGTGFYIKRVSLYGSSIPNDLDPIQLRQSFGRSNEFVKSVYMNCTPNKSRDDMMKETRILASCDYDNGTKWGEEIGFWYSSVAEDYLTGFLMHCNGWKSVFLDPPRPQFLGNGNTNLNDLLVQGIRWSSGLVEVGISRFCPLIYGPLRMSFLQCMCYGELSFFPFYFIPLWCFASIPQLCLLNEISLYPEVSSSYFILVLTIFLSASSMHLYEVLMTGGSFQTWINEQRIWMIKSITFHLYGSFDAFMKRIGLRKVSFSPTSKVVDDEQLKRYQTGIFDFRTSVMFLIPMVALTILNMVSFGVGVSKVCFMGNLNKMFVQILLSFYILLMSFPIIEAMFIRKDKGSIPPRVTIVSAFCSLVFLYVGSIVLV